MAKFMVSGEEKELRLIGKNNVDWSNDFIGNTSHDMGHDEEGRYVATPEQFEWWRDMITQWSHMESVIEEYKERFDTDEVAQVVNDTIGGYDLEDQPRNVVWALEETFGAL
jgi:hypothetical protein